MKTIVSFLKTFALIAVLMIGGCAAGSALGSAPGNPAATQWEKIPDPPERPVKIADIRGYGRDAQSLFVDAASGKQYECCGSWLNVWKESNGKRTREGESCPSLQEAPLANAPGEVIDCAYVTQWEWTTEHYYVVLLEDGSLWRWHYYRGMDTLFNSMMWGALIGFMAAVGIIFYRRQQQR